MSSRRVERTSCVWLCAQKGIKLHRNVADQSSEARYVATVVLLVGEECLGKIDGIHSGQNGPDLYALKAASTTGAISIGTSFEAPDNMADPARANATIDASICGGGMQRGHVAKEHNGDFACMLTMELDMHLANILRMLSRNGEHMICIEEQKEEWLIRGVIVCSNTKRSFHDSLIAG